MREDWDEFMGTKKRTNKTHYSMGRKCQRCQRFITDNNKSGICNECLRLAPVPEPKHKMFPESNEHKALKQVGKQFLESLGVSDIRFERSVISNLGRTKFDVAGKLNNQYVAVECGGSEKRKLKVALSITSEIYILPYNSNVPFKFLSYMTICRQCGHLLSCKVA